nr:hypothetical protein [Nitrospirota bacterium]
MHAAIRPTVLLILLLCLGHGTALAIPDGKPANQGPRTLVVAGDGSGQFTSIQ